MKIVLVCNILISSGLSNGICRKVVMQVMADYMNQVSDDIVREYRDLIQRSKFKKIPSGIERFFKNYMYQFRLV